MKKILSIFAITLLQSSLSLAQGIGDISIEPKSPSLNQPFKVTISSNGDTPSCGLQINLGDGTTRDIRAEKFPVVVDHTYAKEGNFAIAVNGKMILRGLSSMFPCAGDTKTLAVGISTQAVNTSIAQITPTNNPIAQLGNILQDMQKEVEKVEKPISQQVLNQQKGDVIKNGIDFLVQNNNKSEGTLWSTLLSCSNYRPGKKGPGSIFSLKNNEVQQSSYDKENILDFYSTSLKITKFDNNFIHISREQRKVSDSQAASPVIVNLIYEIISPYSFKTISAESMNKDGSDRKQLVENGIFTNSKQQVNPLYNCAAPETLVAMDNAKNIEKKNQEKKEQQTRDENLNKNSELVAKGTKIAGQSKTPFKLFSKKDNMTSSVSYTARYDGKVGKGTVEVLVFCGKGHGLNLLESSVSFHGVDVPFGRNSSNDIVAVGRIRHNTITNPRGFPRSTSFKNVVEVSLGRVENGVLFEMDKTNPIQVLHVIQNTDTKLALYDVAVEIPTSNGSFFVEMSPYDPAIKRVVDSCK